MMSFAGIAMAAFFLWLGYKIGHIDGHHEGYAAGRYYDYQRSK